MRFAPRLITAPSAALVSLAEAKAHLRVEHGDDDALIGAMIHAATAHLDGWTGVLGRALVTQTWELALPVFEPCIRLPLPPIASIVSVKYDDAAGVEQTVSASLYELIEDQLWIKNGLSWPSPGLGNAPVRVRYVAGYGAAADVPAPIRSALLLLIGDLYEHRQTAVVGATANDIPMSTTVDRLLAPYRAAWLGA